jgi:hypothetical protein
MASDAAHHRSQPEGLPPVMGASKRPAHADVPRRNGRNSGGGIAQLQSGQESARQHWAELGMDGMCARSAAQAGFTLTPSLCDRCYRIWSHHDGQS